MQRLTHPTKQLRFHNIHGHNLVLSRNFSRAERLYNCNNGISFSDRPVSLNEIVLIKCLQTSERFKGTIRFGFTRCDPVVLGRNSLPSRAPSGVQATSPFWTVELAEYFHHRDRTMFFYHTSSGVVHYGIDGVEIGVFKIPSTSEFIWAVIDVYGKCSSIELLDRQAILELSLRLSNTSVVPKPVPRLIPIPQSSTRQANIGQISGQPSTSLDERVVQLVSQHVEDALGNIEVKIGNELKRQMELRRALVQPSQRNNGIDPRTRFTIPARVTTTTATATATAAKTTTSNGINRIITNATDVIRMYTLPTSTNSIQTSAQRYVPTTSSHGRPTLQMNQDRSNEFSSLATERVRNVIRSGAPVRSNSTNNNRTSMVSNQAKESTSTRPNITRMLAHQGASSSNRYTSSSNSNNGRPSIRVVAVVSNRSNTANSNPIRAPCDLKLPSNQTKNQTERKNSSTGVNNECCVCYEKSVDAAIYKCGHTCMCYECAQKLWHTNGCCPICRAKIQDIIRIYKS